MKVLVQPQLVNNEKMLFTKNTTPPREGKAAGPQMYSVALQSEKARKTRFGNRIVSQHQRAYIQLTETQLNEFFAQVGLADSEGRAIAKHSQLAPGQWSEHQKNGYHDYELVTEEDIKPLYTDQQFAANLNSGKVYVDEQQRPVYRTTNAMPIDGYQVLVGESVIFDSLEHQETYDDKYSRGLTEIEPMTQALQAAFKVLENNEGARLQKVTRTPDETYVPIVQGKNLIKGSRPMTEAEKNDRIALNKRLGRAIPAAAPAPAAPAAQPQATVAAGAELQIPDGQAPTTTPETAPAAEGVAATAAV